MIELFIRYPALKERLSHVPLGNFPTPIHKLDNLGSDMGSDSIYIKRDDRAGRLYGGNKVRKLEFILGHALETKVKKVMTFGAAGSNHALATAIFAHSVGLKSISMLFSQPNARYVQHNLLASHFYDAELKHYPGKNILILATFFELLRHRVRYGYFPRVIPPGGSSPLGTVGFVNAALELKKQVEERSMPEPDYIYVPLGTMGTAVGLLLGTVAAGLKSKIAAVRVVDSGMANIKKAEDLFNKTNILLHSMDPSFELYRFPRERIIIEKDFFGERYALFTQEAMEAVCLIKDREDIDLEGTYTGKTLAALISDCKGKSLNGKVILFWNTHNSVDLTDIVSKIDYRELPSGFHPYFEKEFQPLDK